ncbi:MAG: helix-turn-helix domain-containing protein [Anaerovoracaceae bacterium]
MNEKLKETGSNIRLYRQSLGISLQNFSEQLHKSKATVSKYENGQISIDLETLLEICQILRVPAYKLLPKAKPVLQEKERGLFHSRQYLYSYARKGRKLTKSVLDHYTGVDATMDVTFFYDVPDFDQLEKCRGLFEGTMCKEGTILNYQFVNRRNSTEHTFLCCLESLVNDGYNMGLLSSISYDTISPNAIKVVISPVPLKENDQLKELLLFDREDIQRLKRDNMLTIMRK